MSPTDAAHYRWNEIPWETLNEKINRRFIYGDKIMLTQLYLEEGAVVPEHHHWNEQNQLYPKRVFEILGW